MSQTERGNEPLSQLPEGWHSLAGINRNSLFEIDPTDVELAGRMLTRIIDLLSAPQTRIEGGRHARPILEAWCKLVREQIERYRIVEAGPPPPEEPKESEKDYVARLPVYGKHMFTITKWIDKYAPLWDPKEDDTSDEEHLQTTLEMADDRKRHLRSSIIIVAESFLLLRPINAGEIKLSAIRHRLEARFHAIDMFIQEAREAWRYLQPDSVLKGIIASMEDSEKLRFVPSTHRRHDVRTFAEFTASKDKKAKEAADKKAEEEEEAEKAEQAKQGQSST